MRVQTQQKKVTEIISGIKNIFRAAANLMLPKEQVLDRWHAYQAADYRKLSQRHQGYLDGVFDTLMELHIAANLLIFQGGEIVYKRDVSKAWVQTTSAAASVKVG